MMPHNQTIARSMRVVSGGSPLTNNNAGMASVARRLDPSERQEESSSSSSSEEEDSPRGGKTDSDFQEQVDTLRALTGLNNDACVALLVHCQENDIEDPDSHVAALKAELQSHFQRLSNESVIILLELSTLDLRKAMRRMEYMIGQVQQALPGVMDQNRSRIIQSLGNNRLDVSRAVDELKNEDVSTLDAALNSAGYEVEGSDSTRALLERNNWSMSEAFNAFVAEEQAEQQRRLQQQEYLNQQQRQVERQRRRRDMAEQQQHQQQQEQIERRQRETVEQQRQQHQRELPEQQQRQQQHELREVRQQRMQQLEPRMQQLERRRQRRETWMTRGRRLRATGAKTPRKRPRGSLPTCSVCCNEMDGVGLMHPYRICNGTCHEKDDEKIICGNCRAEIMRTDSPLCPWCKEPAFGCP